MTKISESPEDPFALPRAASAVLDHRGMVVGWSGRAEQLLGYPSHEAIGRWAIDLLGDLADPGAVREAAAACVRDRGWFGMLPVRHRDGERIELGVRVRFITRDGPHEWFVVGAPAEEILQWETDRSLLNGLFRRSPIGLAVHSPDLRLLRVNRAIARITALPAEQHRGLPSGELLITPDARAVERRLRQVLETGKPVIFTEQSARLRRDPDRERVVSVSAFRLEDSSGRVLGVTETVEDVTERYRARRRLALLNEASARIVTALDVGETARALAEVAVPDLADGVSVDLLEPVVRGEEPPQERLGPMIRMAVRSISAEAAPLMYPVGELVGYPPASPQARCMARRRAVIEPTLEISPDWFSMDPDRFERILALGVHSLMVVPLTARGLVLGLMSLWRARRPEPFEEEDLTLAEDFAARAALFIDNVRRYTQQHQAALALQRSLLPHQVPEHPAAEVAHRYLPAGATAGVGGDWFDVIPLSGARVALVVGDTVGRGIHAAATMGRLRTAVHTLANLDLEPDEVLSHLDDLVNRLATEQEADGEDRSDEPVVGATCLYAVYDPVSRRCALARAGHLPPVMVTPAGQVSLLDLPPSPPLGLGGLPFEATELELAEGSMLAFYTNGLVHSRQRDIGAGLALLSEVLRRPARPLDETSTVVVDSLLPDRPTDDVALLLARTRVLAPELVATWHLPAAATAAAHARALTAAQLVEWGLEDMRFTTELIVSELVTNAYRYASGPVTLRLIRFRYLICEVSDLSSTSPHLRRARSTDEGGRGLFLVAQLTERWGTRYARDGKTVWTEQPLASPASGSSGPSHGPRAGRE